MRRALVVVASVTLIGVAPPAFAESTEVLIGTPRGACAGRPYDPARWTLDGEVELRAVLEAVAKLTCERFIVPKELLKQKVKLSLRVSGEVRARELRERVVGALRAEGIALEFETAHRVARAEDPRPSLFDPPRSSAPPVSDEELDKGIRCTGPRCTITRAIFDRMFGTSQHFKTLRVVPALEDGRAIGFKLYGIRPQGHYARLGLQNGDTITAVNGFEMSSPEKVLEVYVNARKANKFTVDLLRRGEKLTLEYVIK